MENELLEIQERLAKVALQRQQERLDAHKIAMQELAEAKTQEDKRQEVAREEAAAASERAKKRRVEAQEAEATRVREEAELRRSIEQEENKKQESIDRIIQMKEAIKKQMDELEHAEELAKRQLRDAILQNTTPAAAEPGLVNPLARFLQKAPQ
jgi:hypothetical protein